MAKQITTRLYLARHGQISLATDVFYGCTDIDINAAGRKQAQALARVMKNISVDRIYTSRLKRTISTAQYISRQNGISIAPLEQLNEFGFGHWEGKTVGEIKKLYPAEFGVWVKDTNNFKSPGGESFSGFRKRVEKAINGIAGKNKGRNILVVCHAGVIRAYLAYLFGVDFRTTWKVSVDYCSLSKIEFYGKYPVIAYLNYVTSSE
ncbi:MAG: alpha-ribazole phosphatase [Planctomycetes bacterium]|nr:alpha-ribazole phosphatase [Planctomycetota bacterium]